MANPFFEAVQPTQDQRPESRPQSKNPFFTASPTARQQSASAAPASSNPFFTEPPAEAAYPPDATLPDNSLTADPALVDRSAVPPMSWPMGQDAFSANEMLRQEEMARAEAQRLASRPLDPAGFPIDTNRPIVTQGAENPVAMTEQTITVPGTALGTPYENRYFNIPSIYDGILYSNPDEAVAKAIESMRAGQLRLTDIPQFDSEAAAIAAAPQRSAAISDLRQTELTRAEEAARISNVMAQPGPTVDKANINLNPSISGVSGVPGAYMLDLPQGSVPISDEDATSLIARGNTFQLPNNAVVRGIGRTEQGIAVLMQQFGILEPADFVSRLQEIERVYPQNAPEHIQKGLEAITREDATWGETFMAMIEHPDAVLSVVGESLAVSAPSLVAGTAAGLTGGPVAGAVAMGTVSGATEAAQTLLDEIRSTGVDINDSQAMMALLGDEAFMAKARERAALRGVPIGVFDALSMGIAGKLVGFTRARTVSGAALGGAVLGEGLVLQPGAGALGEGAAQTLEIYRGFRDRYNKGEIGLEAVGEIVPGSIEMAASLAQNQADLVQAEARNMIKQMEQEDFTPTATQAAIQSLQTPQAQTVAPEMPFSQSETDVSAPVSAPVQPVEGVTSSPAPLVAPSSGDAPTVDQTPPPSDAARATVLAGAIARRGDMDEAAYNSMLSELDKAFPGVAEEVRQRLGIEQQAAAQPTETQQQAPEDDGFNPPELSNTWFGGPRYPTASRPGPVELGKGMEITAPTAEEPYGANNPQHIPMQIPSYSKEAQTSWPSSEVQSPDGAANYIVQTQIVDLADLKTARGDLQPRDRDLKESAAQILRNASPERFNPSRLMEAPTIDDGAPIIAKDGTILSGNGRAMTLVEVFNNHPESKQKYIEELRKNGVKDEVIAQFRNPVMVRFYRHKIGSLDQYVTPFEELLEFTRLANKDNKAGMTATEVAQSDAKAMTTGMINLYQGGDFTSLDNRPFVENFVKTVVSPNELNNFSRNGKPTQAGIQRMKAAVLASAYEDTDVLAAMLDSTDDNVRAISNAMMQTAPLIAGLKADIKAGRIQEEFDISGQISQAVQTIRNLRENGVKPRDFFAQQDAFTETDPVVEAIIRAFYNEELTRAKSQAFMIDVLKFYAEEAANRQTDALFADETTAPDVINAAKNKAERTRDEAAKPQKPATWTSDRASNGESPDAGSQQTRRPKRTGSLKETVNVEAETTQEPNAEVIQGADLEEAGATSDVNEVQPSTKGIMSGRVFMARSETLRQSTYRGAFREAGKDPDKAANLGIEQQYKILQKLVKDKFGLTFIAPPRDGAGYNQVNALLDAYHNLQWMTHTLGLPNKAIGLDGTLALALPERAWGGYLGAYLPQGGQPTNVQSDIDPVTGPVVIMPRRSNSFAHEWGHALDFFLMDKYGTDESSGITGLVKSNMKSGQRPWQSGAPLSVQEAMAGVINAMFLDKADLALKVMQLQNEIVRLEAKEAKSGKPIKKLNTLREQLRKLEEGSGRTNVEPSEYKNTSREYGGKNGMADYYLKPTEMFARAFEAYVARAVEAAGGRNEFITKGDDAYQMTREQVEGADERLALTFPKEEERLNIFLAMDRLMEAVRTDAIQNGPVSAAPGDMDAIDATADFNGSVASAKRTSLLELPKDVAQGIIEDQKRTWRAAKQQALNVAMRPSAYTGNTSTQRTWSMWQDLVGANLINTKRQILFNISDRYKGNPRVRSAMEKIIARVATDPGSLDNRVTVKGGTFEEATRKNSRRFFAIYDGILNKYKLDELSTSSQERLRLILTGDEKAWRNAPANLSRAAGELRTRLLNPMYDYMTQNNVEINYVQGAGYMPRILDSLLAIEKPDTFTSKETPGRGAYALYSDIIYENEYGAFEEGNAEQIADLIKLGRKLDGRLSEEMADAVDALRQLNKSIEQLNKEIENREQAGEDTDAQNAKVAELSEEMNSLHEEVYEGLRDPYAEAAAKDWHSRIIQRNAADPSAHGPQGNFAAKRKLPPEADSYMVDFYLRPHEAILEYIPSVVRKTEFENRFGTHLVPKGEKKKVPGAYPGQQDATKNYLEYLLEQAVDAGMKPHEKHEVMGLVNKITGRESGQDTNFAKVMNFFNLWGTMSLLERAVMSSLVEPMTVAVQTGRVRDGFKNMAYSMDGMFASVRGQAAAERKVYYSQLANILGVIDLPQTGEMIANRLGGTAAEDAKSAGRLSRFFLRTGLTGLTNAQRKGSMRVGIQFLEGVAAQFQNNEGRLKTEAEQTLRDFGIKADDMDAFTKYMTNLSRDGAGLIEIDQIMEASGQLTDMGDMLATAVGRFVDQTIQDPKIVDRPKWAETPVGRVVFGIQSFIAAFQRNVLEMSIKRGVRDVKTQGKALGSARLIGKTILPLTALYGSHLVLTTMREALLNPDKWDEEKENGTLEEYLLKLAFSRSGFTGRMDPIINGFLSLRYQADLSNVLVGASGSYYLKAIQRMYGVFSENNSPNTVAAEYQGVRGAYDVIVPILGGLVATYPGFGTAAGYAAGAANAYAQSPKVTHWVTRNIINELYGVEYYPGRPGGRGVTNRGAFGNTRTSNAFGGGGKTGGAFD